MTKDTKNWLVRSNILCKFAKDARGDSFSFMFNRLQHILHSILYRVLPVAALGMILVFLESQCIDLLKMFALTLFEPIIFNLLQINLLNYVKKTQLQI